MDKKILDGTKKSAKDALKTTSNREIQKAAEATGDLLGNEIPNKIKKAASSSTCEDPSKWTGPATIDEMCSVTSEPTQTSSRRVSSLKDSSVLLTTGW